MKKYGVIPFLRLLLVVSAVHTFLQSSESSILDIKRVKNTFQQLIDKGPQKISYTSSYFGSHSSYSSISQLTQKILAQSVTDNNPVTTFLSAIDKAGQYNNDQSTVMEELLEEQPAVLSVYAEYFLKKQSFWQVSEQQFIQDWKDSLQARKQFTQTCAHLSTQGLRKPLEFFTKDYYQPQLIKAALKERELNDQGYTVFYHGQKSLFGFYQNFCKKLLLECFKQGVVAYKLPDDFFFVRIPSCLKDLMHKGLSATIQQKESTKRQDLVSGTNHDYDSCLSVNGFLFGSTGDSSCSTWNFIVNNTNCNSYSKPNFAKQIFRALDCDDSYILSQYGARIQALENEYIHFFSVGRLLQIAVPAHLVDECTFISSGRASKTSVYPTAHPCTKISKVSEQMPYCKKKDTAAYGNYREDHYCVVMTEDMALNPRSGIKYFSYDGQPKDKVDSYYHGKNHAVTYAEHCAKVDKLVQDVVQAIKKS